MGGRRGGALRAKETVVVLEAEAALTEVLFTGPPWLLLNRALEGQLMGPCWGPMAQGLTKDSAWPGLLCPGVPGSVR